MNKNIMIQTCAISILFFVVLYIVAYLGSITPESGGVKIEPIYVFIALIPFIVLLIASDKLKEIKGPGGIALLMKDEAEKEISLDVEDKALEIDPDIVHAKGGIQSLRNMIRDNPPTALSFTLRRSNFYAEGAIREYLDRLKEFNDFRHIVFVSDEGKFSGYMTVSDFSSLLLEGNLVQKLEDGSILQQKNVHREYISMDSSNRETLSAMDKEDVNELAVVNKAGGFVGIITQEQIVRKVLSKIVREV